MDVEKSFRAPITFRESCRAALFTILVLTYPLVAIFAVAAIIAFNREIRDAAIWCLPAAAILALVRWLNYREAPGAAKNHAARADTPIHFDRR